MTKQPVTFHRVCAGNQELFAVKVARLRDASPVREWGFRIANCRFVSGPGGLIRVSAFPLAGLARAATKGSRRAGQVSLALDHELLAPTARRLGSKLVRLASASTSPVFPSNTIAAPAWHGTCQRILYGLRDLWIGVNRQREILAVERLAQPIVFDHTAEPVLDHAPAAGTPCQKPLVRELDTFLATVLDVGEPDHMRVGRALRIVALELARRVNAGKLQRVMRSATSASTCPAEITTSGRHGKTRFSSPTSLQQRPMIQIARRGVDSSGCHTARAFTDYASIHRCYQ